jgi:hypothetical protein
MRADRWTGQRTGRQIEKSKLTVAFGNFTNISKNDFLPWCLFVTPSEVTSVQWPHEGPHDRRHRFRLPAVKVVLQLSPSSRSARRFNLSPPNQMMSRTPEPISQEQTDHGIQLTTHFHLVPSSKMRGGIITTRHMTQKCRVCFSEGMSFPLSYFLSKRVC